MTRMGAMLLIPDPTDKGAPAIVSDEKGTRLAPAVFIRPVDDPDAPWEPVGYLADLDPFGLGRKP